MKPLLERLQPMDGASWAWLDRRLDAAIPFQWHHHPEFELTLTLNSRGQRFIGDHIGGYDDGDLVLVGPNLPHTWASREKLDGAAPHVALVMWFHPDWAAALTGVLSELQAVSALLTRARRGLRFSAPAADAIRPAIEDMFHRPPPERLLGLLQVLLQLSADAEAEPLASPGAVQPPASPGRGRIDRTLDHIHRHYAEGVSIAELADIAALSPSGLHRLFRRHTRQTVTEYVMRLRIGEACALLADSALPIAHIACTVGYVSLANFNRQFKAVKQMTPGSYRRRFRSQQ
ncbi:MAG TPA: AraC family transcriptional regulator [Devosiaceae bacterium]|jgi:AraC-like DNA-binding protein/mannose-6-phosphate isomerase-like protein (cupin superfamily)|nr:AraC family transcriptional regulator [Devosiaceae bacterium]